MDEHLRTIEMLQKTIAKPAAFVGAFDEPRHVRDDEAAVVAERNHTKVWYQRREGIVGNLGPRGGDARDERRFSSVGKSHQPHIGEELQMELQLLRFPRRAFFEPARGAVSGADEPRVPAPADATLREEHPLAGIHEVADEHGFVAGLRRFLIDQRADRYSQIDIIGVAAGAIRTLAVTAALGVELAIEAIGDERVEMGTGEGIDRSALATVAAVRSAARNELLAPEAHGAGAAGAGLYEDVDFVDEHWSVVSHQLSVFS